MTDINLQNVLKIKILITSVDKKVVKSDLYFFFTIPINRNLKKKKQVIWSTFKKVILF